jgi:predicted nucleic acid-binding protein
LPIPRIGCTTGPDRFPDQRITLVDAVTAVMADKLGMPVWSFDRRFAAMRVKLWRPNA